MIDEFRAAFQELIDTSVASDTRRFPDAVHRVYHGADQIPTEERELALEALGTVLDGGHTGPGITADLCVVAGALVEAGTVPGDAGTTVVRLLRTMGQGAAAFLHAWYGASADPPPDPDEVTADAEQRVSGRLGDAAGTATICWWTIRRHALAASTMLGDHRVRAAVRGDAALSAELIAVANQLSPALPEFEELRALLRMTGATAALVLDAESGRGFQVFFEGIGDNFQLHTLLADALVGEEGQGLSGPRPDPRWTAAFTSADPDPEAGPVRGWWNLLALDGSWVWNEGVPGDIPTSEGEHVLVLGRQPYPRVWNAGRRHPHVRGWLDVDRELFGEELDRWWGRAALAPEPDAPGLPELPELPAESGTGSFDAFGGARSDSADTASATGSFDAFGALRPDAEPSFGLGGALSAYGESEAPWPSALSGGTESSPAPAPAARPYVSADADSAPDDGSDGSGLAGPDSGQSGTGGAGSDGADSPPRPGGGAPFGDAPSEAPPDPFAAPAGASPSGPELPGDPFAAAPGAAQYGRGGEEEDGTADADGGTGAGSAPSPSQDGLRSDPARPFGGIRAAGSPSAEDEPAGDGDGTGGEGDGAGAQDVAATEQIPVLTAEMLAAYDRENETRPHRPRLPPGVSDSSAWAPGWR